MPGTFLLPEQQRRSLIAGFLRNAAMELVRNSLASRSANVGAPGAGVVLPHGAAGPALTGGAAQTGALSQALAPPGAAMPMAPATPGPSSLQALFQSRPFVSADPAIQSAVRRVTLGRQRQAPM